MAGQHSHLSFYSFGQVQLTRLQPW